jgi:endonuclease YncB( thermonuclease family)
MSWRRLWLLIWALSCSLGLTASAAADERVRVKKVYDRDTVLLEDGRKVRYLGINTPEFQEPFYMKAKRFNESLVLGREIRLEFDQERADSQNRVLAYVYAGEQMVNARLIEQGLAHAFFIGPSRRHHALLLRLQAEAKHRKAGMWSARSATKDLKITNVRLTDPAQPDPSTPYVRVANLSDSTIPLAGYVLSNEEAQRCFFPALSLEPGYTVIVATKAGTNRVETESQRVVHCPELAWDSKEGTAFLMDPSGTLVDKFHYKGKRVTR